MQDKYVNINSLKVSNKLAKFVNDELLQDIDVSQKNFWEGFEKAINELAPKNKELLKIRDDFQNSIVAGWVTPGAENSVKVLVAKEDLSEALKAISEAKDNIK